MSGPRGVGRRRRQRNRLNGSNIPDGVDAHNIMENLAVTLREVAAPDQAAMPAANTNADETKPPPGIDLEQAEREGRLAEKSPNPITAVRRIIKDLEIMKSDPPENTWARPKSSQNLLKWRAQIRGPEGSPYEKGIFEISLTFLENYPFSAPLMRFTTQVFHCNVNKLGYVCGDVFDTSVCWSPGLTVDKLLLSLTSLLHEPNPETAINTEAATMFIKDREQYNATARDWTQRYAMDVQWEE